MSLPFWYRLIPAGWPSWLTEFASGLLTDLVALPLAAIISNVSSRHPVTPSVALLLAIATVLSLVYESTLDPHGFDWADIGQRSLGIAAGCAAWGWLA